MSAINDPTVLGSRSIRKLLTDYSIPAIIATMSASLYNIIDNIFIGQGVGPLAISGLALTFPLMNLAAAFGALVGAGGSTLISIKMGQRDYSGATSVLGNVLILNLIIGGVIGLLGLTFLKPILFFFGASVDTVHYAKEYMTVIFIGNIPSHMFFGLNNVVRASGYPRKSMNATLLTVVVNAILDPIFIFVLNMGIRGAAIATIISQLISLAWIFSHLFNPRSNVHFKRGYYRIRKNIVRAIFSIGVSPFILNFCACAVVIVVNRMLARHGGDLAIGAYGISNRMIMLFVMIVLGLNQGMQPIAGYNFGAKLYDRVIKVLKVTILFATFVTTVAFIVGVFLPTPIVRLFTRDEQLTQLAVNAFRIMVLAFPFVGFQMVTSNFLQSIGKAKSAAIISSTRQLGFLIPLLLILPGIYGVNGVWISMPVADLLSTILAAVLLYKEYQSFKAQK